MQRPAAPLTDVRIAIRLVDTRERRHLERVIASAARRSGRTLSCLPESERIESADLLILRRGETGAGALLDTSTTPRPVPVVYSASDRETHRWRLDWPARVDDLIRLLDALSTQLASPVPKE